MSVGNYARVETVPGMLVTSAPSAKIIAPQAGIITDLAVVEGQSVEAGERLLTIDSDRQATAGGNIAGRGIGALEARRQLTQAQVAMASSRADAERTRLQSIIASSLTQAASLREQIGLQSEVVASNQQIFEQIEAVVQRGFVSKVDYEQRRQTLLSSRQSLASLQQRLTAIEADAAEARSQLAGSAIDEAQGISRIEETLQALSGERAQLEGQQGYVITAPISGRVTALATGLGRGVNSVRPLMVIVPEDAELTAELYAPSRAVGFVEPGKETRLLYDAFPYQRFGSFEGSIASISRIAIDPRETDIPFPFEEPVYRISVKLNQQNIKAFGEATPLQAGMTLQANIVLERQSFLGWILQPLNAVLNRTA